MPSKMRNTMRIVHSYEYAQGLDLILTPCFWISCNVFCWHLDKMASDVTEKWACSQCTYANFQTARACTMCRTPRHSVFITEPPCTSSAVCGGEESEQRWPCPDCTYMNVLKSRHCAVCMCRRPAVFDVEDEKEFVCKDECSIDFEQVEKLGKALHKWDCSQCTYKNWPNVKHCTMCGTPKDYVSVGIGSDIIGQDSYACRSLIRKETDNLPEYAEKTTKDFAGVEDDDHHGVGNAINVNLNKRITFLDMYLCHLNKSVDTGCASFLETCAEILRQSSDAEAKLIHYIYHYGEGNRRINGFETMLLNDIDEESALTVVNRSIIDIIRSKNSRTLASVPRFFTDSLSCTVAIPGLASGDCSDEIHKKIRESMYEDYDMTRVANNNALFTLPNAIYDLRPWVVSGESNLRVLMDLDDRQVLDTVCCMDAHSLSGPTSCQTYAPVLLRNRGGGHSLVDAVSQALWGVIDKSNTLRDALYHTLYAMETNFRGRWAASLMKLGLNFDIWMMQRHWSSIIECSDPGFPLEQIHVLVLAQVLNRPIIVFPIESSKLNPFPARDGRPGGWKHPVEGFYPQLPGLNNYRLCPPLLLGYTNGNFYALILPPRPVVGRVDMGRPSRIYRYIRCPPYPLTEYVQFAMDAKEAEDFVKDNIVVDVDWNGQQWIYHSTFGAPHAKNDMGFLLWKDWIKAHFPKIIHEDCEVQNVVAVPEDSASKVGRIGVCYSCGTWNDV
ncbi:Zn-finger in Ran binding protein and others family protein [Brugia pahangi]